MNRKQLQQKIKYYAQYFPFTLNTLLCLVASYFAYKILYRPLPEDTPTSFQPFIFLMGKVIFWFIIAIISLSILSTIATWIYYLILKQREEYKLDVNFDTEQRNGKNKLYLTASIKGVRRPVLGIIKGRLFYDDYAMTDKFSLLSNKRKPKNFWREAIFGRSRLSLPDIKEYELRGGFIFFEDMLHILSFAVPQPVKGQFYQPPVLKKDDDRDVYPKQTEELDIRIYQLRPVEGDLHNYKDFESGDDIRRIVWKVYAKNRELVVRIPERFEPYASHLDFYASFNASVKTKWLNDNYLKEMLNYYKNFVWTVYDTLSQKEWALNYVADQSFNLPEQLTDTERSARIISNSTWQQDTSLLSYFNPKRGSVLCVSSFTDPDELEQVLEQCDANTVVYFIKTSRVFRHFVAWNWLKRLILLPPKDRLNKLRSKWTFSPMRLHIQKKEKKLVEIIQKSDVTSAIL